MMNFLFNQLLSLSMEGPKQIRPGAAVLPAIIALVKSAVEVLDAALRE